MVKESKLTICVTVCMNIVRYRRCWLCLRTYKIINIFRVLFVLYFCDIFYTAFNYTEYNFVKYCKLEIRPATFFISRLYTNS